MPTVQDGYAGPANPTPVMDEGQKQAVPSARRDAIYAWQKRQKMAFAANYKGIAAASSKVSRIKYALARAAEDKTVRPYMFHNHEPRHPHESNADFERRMNRDRMRTKRGVDADSVRKRTDLSDMSIEQRAEHRKKKANIRKVNQRLRDKAAIVLEPCNYL